MKIVSEKQFSDDLLKALNSKWDSGEYRLVDSLKWYAVMGPGRSGAIVAVYLSHLLGIPFFPFTTRLPEKIKGVLVADTCVQSGRTLRKIKARLGSRCINTFFVYKEPPRLKMWYEFADG